MGTTGLILAAGLGSRLTAGTHHPPKPLTVVGGTPLLFRTLEGLRQAGCDHAVIVLGHRGDEIRGAVSNGYAGPLRITFVQNPDYRGQNGLSVLAAEATLTFPFVLVMADHVFSKGAMTVIRGHTPPENGATLVVDRRIDLVFDLDDATKVRTQGDDIVAIGKHLDPFDCIDTGMFVGTEGLIKALAAVRQETGDASLSQGIERLATTRSALALDIGDEYWQDVDTPAMRAVAESWLAQHSEA